MPPSSEPQAWKWLVAATLYWVVYFAFPLPVQLVPLAFVGGVVVLGLVAYLVIREG